MKPINISAMSIRNSLAMDTPAQPSTNPITSYLTFNVFNLVGLGISVKPTLSYMHLAHML